MGEWFPAGLNWGRWEFHPDAQGGSFVKPSDFTLLFADDELPIRNIYQKAFSRDGFKVILCEDASQVLEQLDKQKVDLLVLDLHMPGMDQMDLFAILREKYPAIPALVVSGAYSGLVD